METKSWIRLLAATFAVIMFLGAGTAQAFPDFSVQLTVPNESGMPNMTYATVEGTAIGPIFHFKVDLAKGLKEALNGGRNFRLDKFFFNANLDPEKLMILNYEAHAWNISYDKQAAGFGKFDIRLMDSDRPSTSLSFDILSRSGNFLSLSDNPAGNGSGHFALHIGGFEHGDLGSIFVRDGEPVPEPGTMLLLGISLLTAAGYMRRMNK